MSDLALVKRKILQSTNKNDKAEEKNKTYENIFPIYPRYLIEYIAAVAGMKGKIIEYPDLFI
jgi:hypothetical protein